MRCWKRLVDGGPLSRLVRCPVGLASHQAIAFEQVAHQRFLYRLLVQHGAQQALASSCKRMRTAAALAKRLLLTRLRQRLNDLPVALIDTGRGLAELAVLGGKPVHRRNVSQAPESTLCAAGRRSCAAGAARQTIKWTSCGS